MKTLIENGYVMDAECRRLERRSVCIEDDIIVPYDGGTCDSVIDAAGQYVLPGWIDIHLHGAFGVNFAKEGCFDEARLWLAREGVTTVAPTVSTRPMDETLAAIRHILTQRKRRVGASFEGIHLEGPFISPDKLGAMNPPDIARTVENLDIMLDAGEGQVRIVALAPELDGALALIRRGVARGVQMSLGHTLATYVEAMAAIEAGASFATHTFNAMRAYDHREPGVLGAVLTEDRVTCEMIADMVHLAPATAKLILRVKGADRVILISDGSMISGLPDGDYDMDGRIRYVRDGVSRNANGNLASSTVSMAQGARNLRRLGVSIEEISRMGALNPARALGIDSFTGSIGDGQRADVLVCDGTLNCTAVFAAGERIV